MGEVIGYCEICGKQYFRYRSFQKYCSNKCRKIAYEKDNYGYKKKNIEPKKCKHCGKEFKTNNKKKVYCCNDCYVKHQETVYTKIEKEKRKCAVCNKEFESNHVSKKYCSSACYYEAKKQREKRSI